MITRNITIKKTDKAACSLCLANSTIITGGAITVARKPAQVTAMRASSEKCLLSQSQNAKFGNIVPADKASRGVKHAMIKTKQNNVRHDFG